MKDITYRRCDYGYIHGSGRCSAQATYRAVFTDGELDRIAAAFADAPPVRSRAGGVLLCALPSVAASLPVLLREGDGPSRRTRRQ